MVIVINPKDENEFCLTDFLKSIKKLEFVLNNYKIYEKLEYKEWFDEFKEIYSKKEINLNLYIVFASIYLIGYIFVAKEILKKRISIPNVGRLLEFLQEVEDNINDKNNSLNIFELNYFNPIWRLSNEESLEFFLNSIVKFANFIFQQNISPEYFFDYIIQTLLPINTRHKSGEFYTPPFLVKSMVKESYKFGESILDPCCGSGNFLIEVIKLILCEDTRVEVKLRAIKKVFGVDINPISIYISKINIIFLLQDFVSHISLNLFKFDSLFHVEKNLNENFDLVLGNPPWYTYHNIESLQYQERIKNLAKDLNIKPLPKNLLNLEISTLFFIKAKNSFLKDGGKIFFVITKGVITGSHTSRFRNFRGFSEIMIWKFDKKLEKIFNIDFICLFGIKSENHSERFNREIKCYFFSITNENEKINYFDHIELKLVKTENLIPYDIEEKGGKVFTKKLISVKLKKKLIPFKESYYKPFFIKEQI
ncbi:MAG: class I SAM-dependent DNA methyltransferase [Promethearchaeota archaeon]